MEPLKIIGLIFFGIGMCIFVLGKQLFLLRLYFGDRSMFTQIIWGVLISLIGIVMLVLSGAFV